MIVCFTLDDGLKSQMRFWNKTLIPSTYFILPEATELKTNYGNRGNLDILSWGEVRLLAKHNEIGFHGYSTKYENWGVEKTKTAIEFHLSLFERETGRHPKSFAYTDMRAFQLPLVMEEFSYIRDYFWRDKDEKGNYNLRMPNTPEKMKPWLPKIFCIHPNADLVAYLKAIKRVAEAGYEYCVIILHGISNDTIYHARVIASFYDTCTFKQIFEGRGPAAVAQPAPSGLAAGGSTPPVSPAVKK